MMSSLVLDFPETMNNNINKTERRHKPKNKGDSE